MSTETTMMDESPTQIQTHSETTNPPILVFVYGSLKRGFYNHKMMKGEFVGEASLPGAKLYSLGPCPGVKLDQDPDQVVQGEVFNVTPGQLQSLDWFEGHPNHYRRILVTTTDGQQVFVYEYQYPIEPARFVESGLWLEAR